MSENEEHLVLKLGDIIEILSPSNPEYHQKTFFIDYIDDTVLEILDVSNGFKHILSITEDGFFTDESIKQVNLLSRAPEEGYARQNGLVVGAWVNLQFGGEIPTIITGEIANLDEDMIEVITYPDSQYVYIDFAYKGLPKYVPLIAVSLREKPARVQGTLRSMVQEDAQEGLEGAPEGNVATMEYTPTGEISIYVPPKPKLDENYKDVVKDLVFNIKDLVFGDEEEIEVRGEVKKSEQRYGIDIQLNDLFDELLSTIPNSKRTAVVMDRVHTIVRRFKELREQFSTFDTNGNVTGYKNFDAAYKPVLEHLTNMDRNLRWIMPVVNHKVKLYDIEDQEFEHETVSLQSTLINVLDFVQKRDIHKAYSAFYENIDSLATPFEPITNEKGVEVKTEIDTLVSGMEDYYSFVVQKLDDANAVATRRFVLQRYNTGLSKMHQHTMKSGKTVYMRGPMTQSDSVQVQSWAILPKETVEMSRIDMPGTNIADRVSLSHNWLYYYRMLRQNLKPSTIDVGEEAVDYEGQGIPFLTSDGFTGFQATHRENTHRAAEDTQKGEAITHKGGADARTEFLNNIIPRSRSIISMLKDQVKNPYSFLSMISFYEPFLIYPDNITYGARTAEDKKKGTEERVGGPYQEIRFHVKEMIKTYKEEARKKGSEFSGLLNKRYDGELKTPVNIITRVLRENTEFLDTINTLYGLDFQKQSSETLNKIIATDGGAAYAATLSLMLGFLFKPELASIMAAFEGNAAGEDAVLKTKSCATRSIAKKYTSVAAMQKDNNTEEVYFDEEYDDTPYSLIKRYAEDQKKMLPDQFLDYLKLVLVEKHDANKETVDELAANLIAKKKRVRSGNYAMLEIVPKMDANAMEKLNAKEKEAVKIEEAARAKRSFYVRRKDNWVHEDVDDDTFCNLSKDCYLNANSKDPSKNTCESVEATEQRLMNKDRAIHDKTERIDTMVNLTMKDMEDELASRAKYHLGLLKKMRWIRDSTVKQHSIFAYQLGTQILDSTFVESPYAGLRDHILGQADFPKRCADILRFRDHFCREAVIGAESEHWLYCVDTNSKLMPRFLYELAYSYVVDDDYEAKLDQICRRIGKLSEDQDAIVDKHSGYVIRVIDFAEEEGFNEAGFKISTRDVMEGELIKETADDLNKTTVQLGKKTESGHRVFENVTTQHIYNIASAICQYVGVNFEIIDGTVMSLASEFVNNLDSPEAYKAKQEKAAKKNIKIASYETYYDQNKIYYTACVTFVAIQTAIPSFRPRKTFPGCMFSFAGFPLEAGEENTTGLKYIACVIENIKSSLEPWNSIGNQKRDIILQRLMELMTKRVIMHPQVEELLKLKRAQPEEEAAIPVEHDVTKWTQFQPPIVKFSVEKTHHIMGLSPEFKANLADAMSKGSKDQRELMGAVYQKIIAATYGVVESVNKQVAVAGKEALLRAGTIIFLENACCEDRGQGLALDFFKQNDEAIQRYINSVKANEALYHDSRVLCRAPYLFYPKIEGKKAPEIKENQYAEDAIYQAFIHYCKLMLDMPVPDDLITFYPSKPKFDKGMDMAQTIDYMKRTGQGKTQKSLDDLMQIIARRNVVHIDTKSQVPTAEAAFMDVLELMTNDETLERPLAGHIEKIMAAREAKSSEEMTTATSTLKRYLLKANRNLLTIVENYMNDFGSVKQSMKRKHMEHMQNICVWKETANPFKSHKFIQNCVYNLTKAVPSILRNKLDIGEVNESVMKHWGLSQRHNEELEKYVEAYYSKLRTYVGNPVLTQFMKDMEAKMINLNLFLKHIPVGEDSLFDIDTVKLLQMYIYYSVFYEMIVMSDADIYVRMLKGLPIETDSNQTVEVNEAPVANMANDDMDILAGSKPDFKKMVCNLICTMLDIEMGEKSAINVDYAELADKVFKASKAEKKTITDHFEKMQEDERNTEFLLKKYKMGMWNVGEEKGIFKYDAKTYDREVSGQMAANTQMDAHELAMAEEAAADEAADAEAYDISGLGDDYMDGAYYEEDVDHDFD